MKYQHRNPGNNKQNKKFTQFRNLVKNRFLVEKTVKYYASQLHITPNYLNEISKRESQKTAKQIILEHILQEAKNLLIYTNKDINEIAFYLGFDEPTHFIRFFKKSTQSTPSIYRKQHL